MTRTRDRGVEKFESLKDFEVYVVLEKELRFNIQDLSTRSARSFARSSKKNIGVVARSFYQYQRPFDIRQTLSFD
jgi:hypothetical protein